MKLQNPVFKLNLNYAEKRGTAEKVASGYHSKEDVISDMVKLAETTNRTTLAYLWLAVELDCNILVFSNSETASKRFIESICQFVPTYKTVVDMRPKNRELDDRLNIINMIGANSSNVAMQLKSVQKLMPDRIMIDNADKNLDKLFMLSKEGISFISSIKGFPIGRSIVKMLQSRPFKVSANNIHMLDISIILKEGESGYGIHSITEYRWINRAEIKVDTDGMEAKMYRNVRIFMEGLADPTNAKSVMESKVVKNYADYNLMDEEETAVELNKRASFLDGLVFQNRNSRECKGMEMYYEIK